MCRGVPLGLLVRVKHDKETCGVYLAISSLFFSIGVHQWPSSEVAAWRYSLAEVLFSFSDQWPKVRLQSTLQIYSLIHTPSY